MKNIFFIVLFALTFISCSSKNIPNKNTSTDFANLTQELSSVLCENLSEDSSIYVTDFVNETNLKNLSQLGFLLANELKVNILNENCKENISIKTLELSKKLRIGKRGSNILSRDFKRLKITNLEEDKKIIVGSYLITHNQLILFTKLIDLETSNTISSSRVSTPLTNEIKKLEGIDTTNFPKIYTPLHL